jgi:hypothetical protein
VPCLHAVHAKQWDTTPHGLALVDAFVPAGLTAPDEVTDRQSPWPGDALLVGSTSLSLGIAEAALERMRGAGDTPLGADVDCQELLVAEHQFAFAEHALTESARRLRAAVEAHAREPRTGGNRATRKTLAQAMGAAASAARLAVTFAYETSLDSPGTAARNAMEHLMAAAAPALQNARFAGEFLELRPEST